MKVSAYKRQQRHVRARRTYWASVYTHDGLRRVPMPFIETYTEEGEIVPLPPLKWNIEMPLLNLIPRKPAPYIEVQDWKPIIAALQPQEQAV